MCGVWRRSTRLWLEAAVATRLRKRRRAVALKLLRKLHQTIAKITLDFEGRWHFNTCVAAIMELVNELQAADAQLAAGEVPAPVMRELLQIAGAAAGAVCAVSGGGVVGRTGRARARCCARRGRKSDPELAKEDEIEIPVQINGKLVTVVRVAADSDCEND